MCRANYRLWDAGEDDKGIDRVYGYTFVNHAGSGEPNEWIVTRFELW